MTETEFRAWFYDQKDEEGFLRPRMLSPCWNWTKELNANGYGQTKYYGKRVLTHRLSFRIANGVELKKKEVVRHMCHNRMCFRPAHLRLGSQADNVQDTMKAGRHRGFSGIPQEKEEEILEMLEQDMSLGQICTEADTSYETIRRIKERNHK